MPYRKLVAALRLHEWWPSATSKGKTTLLLLGMAGMGTRFHLDRTEAINIAFAIARIVGQVLAIWVFLTPRLADILAGLSSEDREAAERLIASPNVLSDQQIDRLELLLGPGSLFRVQRHGDVVHVPPGWQRLLLPPYDQLLMPIQRLLPLTQRLLLPIQRLLLPTQRLLLPCGHRHFVWPGVWLLLHLDILHPHRSSRQQS